MAECELDFESADTCCIVLSQSCSRASINDNLTVGESAEGSDYLQRIVHRVRVSFATRHSLVQTSSVVLKRFGGSVFGRDCFAWR